MMTAFTASFPLPSGRGYLLFKQTTGDWYLLRRQDGEYSLKKLVFPTAQEIESYKALIPAVCTKKSISPEPVLPPQDADKVPAPIVPSTAEYPDSDSDTPFILPEAPHGGLPYEIPCAPGMENIKAGPRIAEHLDLMQEWLDVNDSLSQRLGLSSTVPARLDYDAIIDYKECETPTTVLPEMPEAPTFSMPWLMPLPPNGTMTKGIRVTRSDLWRRYKAITSRADISNLVSMRKSLAPIPRETLEWCKRNDPIVLKMPSVPTTPLPEWFLPLAPGISAKPISKERSRRLMKQLLEMFPEQKTEEPEEPQREIGATTISEQPVAEAEKAGVSKSEIPSKGKVSLKRKASDQGGKNPKRAQTGEVSGRRPFKTYRVLPRSGPTQDVCSVRGKPVQGSFKRKASVEFGASPMAKRVNLGLDPNPTRRPFKKYSVLSCSKPRPYVCPLRGHPIQGSLKRKASVQWGINPKRVQQSRKEADRCLCFCNGTKFHPFEQ